MKNSYVIIVLLLIVAFGGFAYFRSKRPAKGTPDENKEYLKSLGFGEFILDSVSTNDAAISRKYIEEYLKKGVKMQPGDALYNDVVRIASYSNLFSKP